MEKRAKELAVVLAFAAIMSAVQLAPTLGGYAVKDGYLGFEFPEDNYVYASFVEGAQHGIFLENKQTSEPQQGRYFLPLFLAMGQAARIGMPIETVFVLSRFFGVIFFLTALWIFLGLVFKKFGERFFAYGFISLAGGFGWLVALLGNIFPEVARIKSSDLTFWYGYSLVGNMFVPHRYWALGLALLGFVLVLEYLKKGSLKPLLIAGAIELVIFFIHPVTAIFFAVTVALMQIMDAISAKKISKETIIVAANFSVFMVPAILYALWSSQDKVIAAHQQIYFFIAKQEPLLFYFVGFGMVLILGLIGLTRIPGEKRVAWLLLAWLLGSFALTRVGFGAEYLIFFYIITAVFAVHWLISVRQKIPGYALALLVLACVLSAPFVLSERSQWTNNNALSFISTAEHEALDFLAEQPKGIVMSDQRIGAIISWKTPHKPVLAHAYLTFGRKGTVEDVNLFFSGELGIAEKYGADYVWVNESGKKIFNGSLEFVPIFSNSGVSIYRRVLAAG
ncbi:MAG TPA: hypothetical protein VFF09_01395 [archaeon]|nr:hypothetical protein [archaeon]